MNWSFIICTHDPNQERIDVIISTIQDLRIPCYEIVVVGGTRLNTIPNVNFVSFDETTKPGWITKKKNLGCQIASFENLCIFHDYFIFDYNWYSGWLKFNNQQPDWDITCTPIKLVNGARDYTDWIMYQHPELGKLVPVDYSDYSKLEYQYVSGGYFCVKKKFLVDNLLPENLVSHQAEDVAWSLDNRNKWRLQFNPYSIVRHIKPHRNMKKWRKYTEVGNFHD